MQPQQHNNNSDEEDGEEPPVLVRIDDDDHDNDECPCIPFTSIRDLIAEHLLLQHHNNNNNNRREMRITRRALQTLRHATEAQLAEVFQLASTLRDLQGHRTLHREAFRVAARLLVHEPRVIFSQ